MASALKRDFAYFKTEFHQAELTARENVVELGFRVRDVREPSKRRGKTVHRTSKISESAASAGSSSTGATRESSILGRLSHWGRARPVSTQQRQESLPGSTSSTLATTTTGSGVVGLGECLLYVSRAERTKAHPDSILPESFVEVYRSEPQKDAVSPVFATLLPLPMSAAMDLDPEGGEVPLHIRLESGGKPIGALRTTLTEILQKLDGATDEWVTFSLESTNSGAPEVTASLDIRVATPDRFVSCLTVEDEALEWRSAPLLPGPALRGITCRPLSRGFQSTLRDSPSVAGLVPEETILEVREEMAEMPTNYLFPSVYLQETAKHVGVAAGSLVARWTGEAHQLETIARAQPGYAWTAKDEEAKAKFEAFAAASAKKLESRGHEMAALAKLYRESWVKILGSSPRQHQEDSDDEDELNEEAQDEDDDAESVDGAEAPLDASAAPELTTSSFRKSTDRKSLAMQYIPINMHLQVIAVKDTRVGRAGRRKELAAEAAAAKAKEEEEKAAATAAAKSKRGGQLTGFARRVSTLAFGTPASASSSSLPVSAPTPTHAARTEPSMSVGSSGSAARPEPAADAPIGPLMAPLRRQGRKSIMQIDGVIEGGGMTQGHFREPSSGSAALSKIEALLEEDLEDERGSHRGGSAVNVGVLYDTMSVGCPSAHALVSKQGGGLFDLSTRMKQLKSDLDKSKSETEKTPYATRLEALKTLCEASLSFGERLDVVVPQALSVVVAAIVARLYVIAACPGIEDEVETALTTIQNGFLLGWESLLSTYGKEMKMLEDLYFAVRFVSERVKIRLLTANVREIQTSSLDYKLHKMTSPATAGPSDLYAGMGPGSTTDAAPWLVTIVLPGALCDRLPTPYQEYIAKANGEDPKLAGDLVDAESLSPAPLKITALLFTQGINELQTISNVRGKSTLQESINEHSVASLTEYCVKRFGANKSSAAAATTPGGRKTTGRSVSKELTEAQKKAEAASTNAVFWLAKLRRAVASQTAERKNYEILTYSADLIRLLGGLRVSSCKSAKDRTAMSLTLEEGRILHGTHHVKGSVVDWANILRLRGTRLLNAYKNTGVPRFAINPGQIRFFPKDYHPPQDTVGFYFGNKT